MTATPCFCVFRSCILTPCRWGRAARPWTSPVPGSPHFRVIGRTGFALWRVAAAVVCLATLAGRAGGTIVPHRLTAEAGGLLRLNEEPFQEAPGAGSASSITVEAESGSLGSDWALDNSGSPAFIAIGTDSTALSPGTAARVATYRVTFPAAGTYYLYARIRVGADRYNDDSLFYADGFGAKSPTMESDWVLVNGLGAAGFSDPADVVTGGGSLGGNVWKWINLSLFTDQGGFSVSEGNLTQTVQMGAREDGLDLDELVFGLAEFTFTVAQLDAGEGGSLPALTLDPSSTYQTIEGIGGAVCFYNGWFPDHPAWQEIADYAFSGLNLSMLRLGNWWRGADGADSATYEIVDAAKQRLGEDLPILMSSWSPPAYLKSNGEVGNGGTLTQTAGRYDYAGFADYWVESLRDYAAHGIVPTWVSIQNEPDWTAGYDSCRFNPTEAAWGGTNVASYALALEAVYQNLQTHMALPPKLLGPGCVGLYGNAGAYRDYVAAMNPAHYYGTAHHLYGGSTDGTADGYKSAFSTLSTIRPEKPRFMTEFGDIKGMIECANLIHNLMVVEQASGYNQWSLIWPGDIGLVEIENPYDRGNWTTPDGYWLNPAYWSVKHYSYFIRPGYRRVAAASNDSDVLASAYLSPDGYRLVAVLINRSSTRTSTQGLDAGAFDFLYSAIYQTVDTVTFQNMGPVGAELTLPPASLTTVVLDRFVDVGAASNPWPAHQASGVAYDATLRWSPGSNALTHAVYLGLSSNAVTQAEPASPEFQRVVSTNALSAALAGGATYFWRVDEIAGANTNRGPVWSFSTSPLPALVHRYTFSESGGATVADVAGGPAWNGTLPNGGTFSSGQLTMASGSQQYVRLPPGIVGTFTDFTIEAWVKLNSTANWARLFDFGSNTSVNMFLTPQNGSNGRLRFAITTGGAGGEQQINSTSTWSAGTWTHIAVTLRGNTGTLYRNGVPVGTSTVTLDPSSMGSTENNCIGRSQYNDPYLDAAIDEFRIYSVALSSDEIAATYALGSGQVLDFGSPPVELAPAPSAVTVAWPLASAGFTLQSRDDLREGNWADVPSPAPQILDDQWQVTLPMPTNAPSIFYRLAK